MASINFCKLTQSITWQKRNILMTQMVIQILLIWAQMTAKVLKVMKAASAANEDLRTTTQAETSNANTATRLIFRIQHFTPI